MADRNAEIMVKLYSKLADVLSVGNQTASPGNNFLVLENPGTFLKPDFDLTKVENQFLWSKTLNRIPQNTWIYQDSGQEVDQLFDRILTDKELPILTLSTVQRKQLNDARNILGNPPNGSREYQWYNYYENKFYPAQTAYQNALKDSENRGEPVPEKIVHDYDKAKAEWNTFGYKNVIENAQKTIDNLTALDPNNWWGKLRQDYDAENIQAPSGNFKRTPTFPTYKDWNTEQGWTKFTMTEEDVSKQNTSSHVDIGGGLSGGWGLWSFSTSGSYSKDEKHSSSDINSLDLSVEIMRVRIFRSWVDPLVFRTGAWRWMKDTPGFKIVISDGGDINSGITPKGDMPFLPTEILLAKNLQLSGAYSHDDYTKIDTSFSQSVSVGWGPFSFGGRYNKQTSEEYINAHHAGNSVSCPDIQIIGWLCDVLPRCPFPDGSLNWPTPMTFEHIPDYQVEFLKKIMGTQTK